MSWFRDLGDVFQIWIVHRRVVVSANPEDVVQILGKPSIFARPTAQTALFNDLQPDNFQTMPRDIHRQHRTRLRDAFSAKTLAAMTRVVTQTAEKLASRMKAEGEYGKPINLTPHLADTTFSVLLGAAFGSKMSYAKRQDFAKQSNLLLTELLFEYFTYPLRRVFSFLGLRKRLFLQNRVCRKVAEDLLVDRMNESEEQKKSRPYDLLDVIRELTPEDMSQQICNTTMFAIAGFESSSEAIAWAIYEISGKPEVEQKIREELADVLGDKADLEFSDVKKLHYLNLVWKETLRMHPAAGLLLRRAEKDTVLPGSGIFIPKGLQVGALIAGAQRNPRYISRADEFVPERWGKDALRTERVPSSAFVPFSCGPERCPGQFLADFEGVIILATLYRNFDIELSCPREKIVGISDWTERPRSPNPNIGGNDLSWTLPVRMKLREGANVKGFEEEDAANC